MTKGAAIGAVGGVAIGLIVVNTLGFPEAEIAEGSVAVMGVTGFETLMGLDALAGESVATYFVGGLAGGAHGIVAGGAIGKGFDWLTGKYDKSDCP
jgi:hypothetical protein